MFNLSNYQFTRVVLPRTVCVCGPYTPALCPNPFLSGVLVWAKFLQIFPAKFSHPSWIWRGIILLGRKVIFCSKFCFTLPDILNTEFLIARIFNNIVQDGIHQHPLVLKPITWQFLNCWWDLVIKEHVCSSQLHLHCFFVFVSRGLSRNCGKPARGFPSSQRDAHFGDNFLKLFQHISI